MNQLTVIVLAAGAASRFGSDKLVAEVHERTVLEHTLDAVAAHTRSRSGDRVVVVVDDVAGRRASLARDHHLECDVVLAQRAQLGMSESLACGLAHAEGEGAIIVLADDPLAARALGVVIEAASADKSVPVAVRRDEGPPHPVYLPRPLWSQAISPAGPSDQGALALLARHATRWIDGAQHPALDVDMPVDALRLADYFEGEPAATRDQ